MTTILYHITPSKNLSSIMEKGLVPAFGKGLYCLEGERRPVVWLTDNPEYILAKQAGEEWIANHKPIVLKVNCDKLDVKQYMSYVTGIPTIAPHEYYVEHTVKQRLVELVT